MTLPMDLRYAVRLLSRAPGFTLAVVVILALGIGSNSAIFTALDQTVLRPLPYRDPQRLITLWEDFSAFGTPRTRVSPATFLDWKKRSQVFEDIAAYAGPRSLDLSGGGPPEEVLGLSVTANFLPMLGVPPLAGRTFAAAEERPDARLVVLSYRLWQRRFGGDWNLVGKSIQMDGVPYTVTGIMPRGFQYPDSQTELWLPMGMRPEILARRNSHFLKVVGRVKSGRDLAQAQSDMDAVARQLAAEFPASNARVGIALVPLREEMLGQSRTAFVILLSAAACVLLMACANVANLLLARASGRRREIAVRAALGAAPGRVLRQILTENLLVAAAGGALGLLFAQGSMAVLERMVPPSLAGVVDLHLNWRVLAFATALSTLTGVLFGIGPALQFSRSADFGAMQAAGRGSLGQGGRLRDALVVAEMAIALVLVVGASLLIGTLVRLRAVDAGFRPEGILTADIPTPPKYLDNAHRQTFYNAVLARIAAIPGVRSAGLTSDLPYTSRGNTMGLAIEGKPAKGDLGQDALFRLVSSGYLETIGARLREGRFLNEGDREEAVPVVVINEALARLYFPGQSALGHRIDTGTGDGKPRWMTIVGVVRDIRERGLDMALKPAVYVPFPQTPITFFQPSEVAILTAREPMSIARELEAAVWAVDREQPVARIRAMSDIVEGELADRTQVLELLGAFAALALVLAALGIYGTLSYVVSHRTREIGLRMAVGATRWDIMRTILGYSARLTTVGLGLGIVAAMAATRLLSVMLYGVSPLDVRTFLMVTLILAAVALLASYIPTRRAAAVDPMVALRNE